MESSVVRTTREHSDRDDGLLRRDRPGRHQDQNFYRSSRSGPSPTTRTTRGRDSRQRSPPGSLPRIGWLVVVSAAASFPLSNDPTGVRFADVDEGHYRAVIAFIDLAEAS